MRRMYSQKQLEKIVDNVVEEKDITPVSGTSDGTNWTSLTIGDETHGLAGGSSDYNIVDLTSYGWSPSGEATLSQEDYATLANANCVITAGPSNVGTQNTYRVATLGQSDSYTFTSLGGSVASTQAGIQTNFIKVYVDSFRKLWTLNYDLFGSLVYGANDGTNWTSLTIGNTTKNIPSGGVTPANYVTIDTNQTITGRKGFENYLVVKPDSTHQHYSVLDVKADSNNHNAFVRVQAGSTNSITSYDTDIDIQAIAVGTSSPDYNITTKCNAILPYSADSVYIGYPNKKFKAGYFTETISPDIYTTTLHISGTNSVSVADLAALVAYAKSQGWIS